MAFGYSEYTRGLASFIALILGFIAFGMTLDSTQRLIIALAVGLSLVIFNGEWKGL